MLDQGASSFKRFTKSRLRLTIQYQSPTQVDRSEGAGGMVRWKVEVDGGDGVRIGRRIREGGGRRSRGTTRVAGPRVVLVKAPRRVSHRV
jgi:hypothetical protein